MFIFQLAVNFLSQKDGGELVSVGYPSVSRQWHYKNLEATVDWCKTSIKYEYLAD